MKDRLKALAAPGLAAVRESFRPFLLIQACAVLAACAYYLWPAFQGLSDRLQHVKSLGGLPFTALSSAFAGAVLPEFARLATRRERTEGSRLVFQLVFFAWLGVTVDLLYRLMALLFGTKVSVPVVLEKVAVDQFVFAPCVSVMFSTLLFAWEGERFSFSRTAGALSKGGFAKRYFPLLVTCWAFWIPVLLAVYALPLNLQYMLFLFTQAAWSLLLVHIAGKRREP